MQSSQEETVYSAEPVLARPGALLLAVLQDLRFSKHLMWRLFLRDLKSQHRQTLLGYAWILIPPFVTTAVWFFLQGQGIIRVGATPLPYPLFVLSGTVLWTTASAAIQKPLMAFSSGKPVLTRLRVPPEPYILTGAAQVFFDFLVKLAVLLPVAMLVKVPPAWTFPLAIAAGACTVCVGTALGLLLVPLGALYDDVGRALGLLLGMALYLAPVVYPVPPGGGLAWLVRLNPFTPCIEAFRDLAFLGATAHAATVGWETLAALPVIVLGVLMLRAAMPHLVVRLTSGS